MIRKLTYLLLAWCFILSSCEINQYNLDKVDVINFTLEYSGDMPDLKPGFRSAILQHSQDSSYFVPVVTIDDRLRVAHISKIGSFIELIDLADAESLVDFIEVNNFYFALVQNQKHMEIVKLSKDFNIIEKWSMGSFVAGSNITETRGGHLFYDIITDNIYVGGICTDDFLGDQMIMMSLNLDLIPVWSQVQKYFNNSIATSTVPTDDGLLLVTGTKSDEAPFYIRMNRFGSLLNNIFLIEALDKDSINEGLFIGQDFYITGTTIAPDRQAVVAKIDTTDQSIISVFGIGCDAIDSRCNNFTVDVQDGSVLALAENFVDHEVHLTKFNYVTESLDWNQCYTNLFGATSVLGLDMKKVMDEGYLIASLESKGAGQYYLRLTKTDRLGEIRY